MSLESDRPNPFKKLVKTALFATALSLSIPAAALADSTPNSQSCKGDNLASIPPTDPSLDTRSIIVGGRERIRTIFPRGAQNPQVGLVYYVPDFQELARTGITLGSFRTAKDLNALVSQEKDLAVDVSLFPDGPDNSYRITINQRLKGLVRGLYMDDLKINQCQVVLNFNFDHSEIFGLMENGQPAKENPYCKKFPYVDQGSFQEEDCHQS